jgi:hypothetical protein
MDGALVTFFWTPGCSSWFLGILGTEMDDARDGSWRRCFTTLLYLAAKPTHMGVDMDVLAYPLHRPKVCGRQTRVQGLLSGVVLFRCCSGVVVHFWGCEVLGLAYLVEY